MNAQRMKDGLEALARAAVPARFTVSVMTLALRDEGIAMLLDLLALEVVASERLAILADIGELIDDHEVAPVQSRVTDVSAEVLRRNELKAHMRALVAEHGGVSKVALAAGMAQPSLSRLPNSGSEPRPATLKRIADAIGCTVAALTQPSPQRRVRKGHKLSQDYTARANPYSSNSPGVLSDRSLARRHRQAYQKRKFGEATA